MSDESKALVPTKIGDIILTEEERDEYEQQLRELSQEEIAGIDPRKLFPTIKIPAGGSEFFEFSDGDPRRSFTAIVALARQQNAYWLPKVHPDYNPNDKLPVCSAGPLFKGSHPAIMVSEDSLYRSFKNPLMSKLYGNCSTCLLNCYKTAYGEDGQLGAGKGCNNKYVLYLFLPEAFKSGNDIPYRFMLPSTSIGNWQTFIGKAKGITGGKIVCYVLTEFKLTVVVGEGARKYSVCEFTIADNLWKSDPVIAFRVQQWAAKNREFLVGTPIIDEPEQDSTEFGYSI